MELGAREKKTEMRATPESRRRESAARVRAMRADDAGSVARLSGELGYAATAEDIEGRLSALTESPHDALLVAAAASGEIVGWIHVSRDATLTDGPIAEIRGLVVDARFRGRGVGQSLVAEAERWAASRGYRRVRVRTRTTRQDAHLFYRACGFELMKTQDVLDRRLD